MSEGVKGRLRGVCVCVCLKVDQVEVGGGEVGTQSHVRVLQLSQDPPVELCADPVELHDVAGILLDPEAVELLHQVTCREEKGESDSRWITVRSQIPTCLCVCFLTAKLQHLSASPFVLISHVLLGIKHTHKVVKQM